MSKKGLVSIIIACFNGSEYLLEALLSIKKQTYKKWEIIFMDDASTDNSKDIFTKFINNYYEDSPEKFYYYKNLKNMGITFTKQNGFEKANGEFVMSLDCDDKIDDYFIEKMLKKLNSNTRFDYVYCDTIYFYDTGKKQRYFQPEFNLIALLENNFISYCCIFKRSAILDPGYDLNNNGKHEDYQLYLRIARNGHYGVHLNEPLFEYRVHKNQSMQTDLLRDYGHLFKAYFISEIPELFPNDWFEKSIKIINKLPKNFINLNNKDLLQIIRNIDGLQV